MRNHAWVLVLTAALLTGACAQDPQPGTPVPPPPAPPPTADASSLSWETNFEAALKRSGDTQRPIFAYFTGSDWCPWCTRFTNEVLSAPVFQTYVRDTFVLFLADFPARTELPPALVEQNKALATRYKVKGFPTMLLLHSDGRVLAQTGYRRGGAEAYIQHLRDLLTGNPPASPPPSPAPAPPAPPPR